MQKPIILIVEDNLQESSLLGERMYDSEMQVHIVHSAKDAVEKEDSLKPDLTIVDYYLPDSDGLLLVTQLRKTNHSRLIIVFSNESSLNTITSCLDAGADNYWVKPMTYKELYLRITTVLDSWKREIVLSSVVKTQHYLFDLQKHIVTDIHKGSSVVLTNNEAQVLRVLLSNCNRVVSYKTLLYTTNNLSTKKKMNQFTLKNIISKLRNKLPQLQLLSKSKVGYKLIIDK